MTILDPVRVAVVGVGQMGQNHLRVYDELKDVALVGVYDPLADAAVSAAARYQCAVFQSIDEVAENVDAVSICSPSSTHADVGLQFLQRGIHCLVEKPLAPSEGECIALIEAADRSRAKLLVGHIERFNPAIQEVATLLAENTTIHAIDARRLSAVSARIQDIDVVSDLMVHDLDIVCSLIKRDLKSLTAAGVKTNGSSGADHVTSLLSFEGGAIATVTASRITQNTVRELKITTDQGFVEIDYINQSIEVYYKDSTIVHSNRGGFGGYALDVAMERVVVRRSEPLVLELAHFMDIVRHDKPPMVSGQDALNVLRLVWRINESV